MSFILCNYKDGVNEDEGIEVAGNPTIENSRNPADPVCDAASVMPSIDDSTAKDLDVMQSVDDSSAEDLEVTFDFSNSNKRIAPSLAEALDQKQFSIRRAETPFSSTIVLSKHHIGGIFEKIHKKFNMRKGELKKMALQYRLPLSNGRGKTMYVFNDSDAEENLSAFYTQMPEMSVYPVVVHLMKRTSQERDRTREKIYKALMVKNFSADIKFYNLLVENLDIAIKFRNARDVVSLMMGRHCQNLVSPGHFRCHITGCQSFFVLGSFSKLSLIKRHWSDHAVDEPQGPGNDLTRRFDFVKSKGGAKWLYGATFEERLANLNGSSLNGKPLTIVEGSYLYIDSDTVFKGKSLLVKDEILNAILEGDTDALSKLPKITTRTMKSFFTESSTVVRPGKNHLPSNDASGEGESSSGSKTKPPKSSSAAASKVSTKSASALPSSALLLLCPICWWQLP